MAAEIVGRGAILAGFCAVSAVIFLEINKKQDVPYMDEIFHVPQAQNYCHGHFDHWNDMITTLPGLYLSSQFFLKVFAFFRRETLIDVCNTLELRSTNMVFAVTYFYIIYGVLKFIHSQKPNKEEEGVVSCKNFLSLFFFTTKRRV